MSGFMPSLKAAETHNNSATIAKQGRFTHMS